MLTWLLPFILVLNSHAMDVRTFRELKSLVEHDILNQCPPERYHLLILGQSPTPVLAYLQNLGIQPVSTLPLSYAHQIELSFEIYENEHLQKRYFGETLKENRARGGDLINFTISKQIIYDHFDQFLPRPENLGRRTLCVIDLMVTGKTMRAAHLLLKRYYQERFGAQPRLITLALDQSAEQDERPYVDRRISILDRREIGERMNSGYNTVSPHGGFFPPVFHVENFVPIMRPALGNLSPVVRPQYLEFKERIRQLMSEDCAGRLR